MRESAKGIFAVVLVGLLSYGLFLALLIGVSPLTSKDAEVWQWARTFLFYWDSMVLMIISYGLAAGLIWVFGFRSWRWSLMLGLVGMMCVLLLYRTSGSAISGFWELRAYLHHLAPAFGSMGVWAVLYWLGSERGKGSRGAG